MEKNLTLTATEMGIKVAQKKICPVELTEAYIEKINGFPQSDQVFTNLMAKQALSEAKKIKSRQKKGIFNSPLDGVPMSWKDLFDIENMQTKLCV